MAFTMDNKFEPQHQLSDVQTQTLLLIFSSPSPAVAAESVRGHEKTMAALQILVQLGLVDRTQDGVQANDRGIAMLDSLNVVDKLGNRTPYGEQEFEKVAQLTNKTNESVWPLISSISQRV